MALTVVDSSSTAGTGVVRHEDLTDGRAMEDAGYSLASHIPAVNGFTCMRHTLRQLLLMFVVLQVLDGWITYLAVSAGIAFEANPLMAGLIQYMGLGAALIASKLLTCGCGFFLYAHNRRRLLIMSNWLYVIIIVFPWTHAGYAYLWYRWR
jgi:hypothetical protein